MYTQRRSKTCCFKFLLQSEERDTLHALLTQIYILLCCWACVVSPVLQVLSRDWSHPQAKQSTEGCIGFVALDC